VASESSSRGRSLRRSRNSTSGSGCHESRSSSYHRGPSPRRLSKARIVRSDKSCGPASCQAIARGSSLRQQAEHRRIPHSGSPSIRVDLSRALEDETVLKLLAGDKLDKETLASTLSALTEIICDDEDFPLYVGRATQGRIGRTT